MPNSLSFLSSGNVFLFLFFVFFHFLRILLLAIEVWVDDPILLSTLKMFSHFL